MPEDDYSFFDERDEARNLESQDRVAGGEAIRAERQATRDVRKAERSQLQRARSTAERRAIKERFEKIQQGLKEGGIYDIQTDTYNPPEGNVAGANTNLTETGVQFTNRHARVLAEVRGFLDDANIVFPSIIIFLMNGSVLEITKNDIFADLDSTEETNWSVSIPILNLAYDSSIEIQYDNETALNVGTGMTGSDPQTIARIPVMRDSRMLIHFGAYKEAVSSKNGQAVVEYYQI